MSENVSLGGGELRSEVFWHLTRGLAKRRNGAAHEQARDIRISIGYGNGRAWQSSLTFATGSAFLAHDVAQGEIDVAFINPAAILTQAYRGVGLFSKELPIRVIWSYPSFDRFVMLVHPRTGLRTVRDLKDRRFPLKFSVREAEAHSTRILLEQIFNSEGFSTQDVLNWGGEIVPARNPTASNRMALMQRQELDAIFDEGISAWLSSALDNGYVPLNFTEESFSALRELGWCRAIISPKEVNGLRTSYDCIDFSGWPVYCRASLDESVVSAICETLADCEPTLRWPDVEYRGLAQLFSDSKETPTAVPLHPGVRRFMAEHF